MSASSEQQKGFYGWWISIAAFFTFGLAVGIPYYGMGFYYDYYQKAFGWTRPEMTLGFPLAVTASADLGDRPAAENVAILSFIALFGFLVGPPMIGFVAELSGLRSGLAMLLPPLLLSMLLAGLLRRGHSA